MLKAHKYARYRHYNMFKLHCRVHLTPCIILPYTFDALYITSRYI
jgi:hypothetical protein